MLGSIVLGLGLPLGIHGCAPGRVGACAGGNCPTVPGCETSVTCDPDHVCVEQVCEGVAWICGVDATGNYVWQRSSAPCDDNDPCTVGDLCLEGKCRGTLMECNEPPPNSCVDTATLRAWGSDGFCQEGSCVYTSSDISCAQGCSDGKCIGAPCTGVTCDKPPSACHQSPGTCDPATGQCSYPAQPSGSPCTSDDPCVTGATCDAAGQCTGTTIDCTRPHTSGGTCVQGTCQGFQCDSGYGNCNDTWDDGCETYLQNDLSNCGGCGKSCGAVAHATASCSSGKCVAKCTSPYKDCDGKYSNGCEIPVDVANKCNRSGLASFSGSTPPCGTAHCGKHATDDYHQDFGTWHCKFCSHCYKFSDGYAWCLFKPPSTGNFSPSRCPSCCNLSDPNYPPVCK